MEKITEKFEVAKEFWIKDSETGFMRIAQIGEILELPGCDIYRLLEDSKIIPCGMPEKGEYIVLRDYTFKSPDRMISLKPDNVVVLERNEAIQMMLRGYVKPRDPFAFFPKHAATIYGDFGYSSANRPLKRSWVRGG